MDLITSIIGNRIYLDANIWIYAFEGYSEYSVILNELFNQFDKRKLIPVTSELTIAEILVKPFIDGNSELQKYYTEIFDNNNLIEVIPINKEILIEAARLSGSFRIKLPDAIHAATSIYSGSQNLLTNDKNFMAIPDIKTLIISDYISF
jgi:predicted nucleic acid-binding protein